MSRDVTITVSNKKTGDYYQSRSYPDDDYDNNGKMELYKTPVYKLFISGIDNSGTAVKKEWKALRFMPYWNDPANPSTDYKTRGWTNAGKWHVPQKKVQYYDPDYGTHNRYSPYSGAIQIDRSFLIHAGPKTLYDYGWGSAGCVEIIGNFDHFKDDIKMLSGTPHTDSHKAIAALVKAGKLYIQVDYATPPNLKANFTKEV